MNADNAEEPVTRVLTLLGATSREVVNTKAVRARESSALPAFICG
jgi:hypothetical protein